MLKKHQSDAVTVNTLAINNSERMVDRRKQTFKT
jgi:hypothetical protein